MADYPIYQTPFSATEIVEAIQKSLNFNPDTIGCIRVDSTASTPYDLNTLTEPKTYFVDYYTNGPVDSIDSRPVVVIVHYINTSVLAQTILCGPNIYIRTKVDSIFQSWSYCGGTVSGVTTGTGLALKVSISAYVPTDMIPILIKLHTPILEGATLQINSEAVAPIYQINGEAVSAGMAEGSILFLAYNKTSNRFYVLGGSGGGGGTEIVSSTALDKIKVENDLTLSINTVSGSKIVGKIQDGTQGKLTFGAKVFDGTTDLTLTAADIDAIVSSNLELYVKKTDFGTVDNGGTVKSSTADNNVNINASTGIMTVNSISGSKIKGSISGGVSNKLQLNIGEDIYNYNGAEEVNVTIPLGIPHAGSVAPEDTTRLWINTANRGMYYYSTELESWVPIADLWA